MPYDILHKVHHQRQQRHKQRHHLQRHQQPKHQQQARLQRQNQVKQQRRLPILDADAIEFDSKLCYKIFSAEEKDMTIKS